MNFLTVNFFLFLLVVMILSYILPSKFRIYLLLTASFFFYSFTNIKFLPLLAIESLVAYVFGLLIHRYRFKRIIYTSGISLLLLPLVYFKYTNFITDMFNRISTFIGVDLQTSQFDILIPLGVSFFTFQAISYIGDIYYKKIHPEINIFKVCLFVSFFPQISSGPIQKARDLIPQFQKKIDFHYLTVKHGFLLIAFGILQKLLVSDKLFIIINQMTNNIESYEGIHYLFFAICYSLYIYSNFNAYSDIAIGVAEILGFSFKPNFRRPYLSRTIKEFWKRWHISLNEWFIEYIYFPLGGSKYGKNRYFSNIIIIFSISGLWHGASFHFLAWGLINAFYQIFGDISLAYRRKFYNLFKINENSFGIKIMQRSVVFILISISWIFFAIPSVSLSIKMITSIFTLNIPSIFDGKMLLFGNTWYYISLIISLFLFVSIQCFRERNSFSYYLAKENILIRYSIYILAVIVIVFAWSESLSNTNTEFIYFNF